MTRNLTALTERLAEALPGFRVELDAKSQPKEYIVKIGLPEGGGSARGDLEHDLVVLMDSEAADMLEHAGRIYGETTDKETVVLDTDEVAFDWALAHALRLLSVETKRREDELKVLRRSALLQNSPQAAVEAGDPP